MPQTVRTRFAPSPTGYLHIGGVRTALFNWLFAKKHGGQFILRIDDTDAERNIDEALAPILHGLRWVGITWDEGPEVGGPYGPYYQSQKLSRYQEAVQQLLDGGFAYHDYATAEENKQLREQAEKEKRTFVYDRRWMAETPEQRAGFEAEGRQAVVRLKMPREGNCVIQDHIRGQVCVEWASEQDHVIQRTDGTCLYHLANVVDDYDMEITHVIRAQEHLSNTPRQVFIAQSLGYPLPEYAHLPFVAEPGSQNKLSKRKINQYLKNPGFKERYDHGQGIAQRIGLQTNEDTFNPVIVDFFEQVGYLPDAIVNYLLLLGWAYDDRKEDFTRQEMIDLFTLERVNRSPASFDPAKMFSFQERHMARLPLDDKVAMATPFLQKAGLIADPPTDVESVAVRQIVEAAGDRIKVAGDILDYADFFTPDDQLTYDQKAFEQRLCKPADAKGLLTKFRGELAARDAWDVDSLEDLLKGFVEREGTKIGLIINALRVATTGKGVGFGMYETLVILGKERSLRRIDVALSRI